MLVAALCNQKGGVGKTTTTINLARAACLRRMRTLVVDLDPQANATSTLLGKLTSAEQESLADVLSARSDATASDVIVATEWAGVDLLPSGSDALADVGAELVTMGPGREHRLREALSALKDYDLALLDAPPALDLLTINALTAAEIMSVLIILWPPIGFVPSRKGKPSLARNNSRAQPRVPNVWNLGGA